MKKLTFLASLLVCLFGSSQAQSQTVYGPQTFTRTSGEPQSITRTFSLPNPGGEYTLIIENGATDGNRVSSAVVGLNGVIIAGPDEFNQKVSRIIKSVLLGQTNTLDIEIRSKPGSSLTISIDTGGPSVVFPRFTLFTNRTDPGLIRAETANGDVIDYFGQKDDKGIATALNIIRVEDAQGRVTTYYLDDQLRPALVYFSNGTIFRIRYLSDTSLIVTVISDNGLVETDIPVSVPASTSSPGASSRKGKSFLNHSSRALKNGAAQIQFAQPTSTVIVKNCGVPVNNANVSMELKTSRGINFNIPGYLTGNGIYQVPIPTPDRTALLRAKQKCLAIAHFLDAACEALQHLGALAPQICPAIALGMAFIPGVDVAAPAVFAACAQFAAGAELYCGLGGPTFSEVLCSRIYNAIDRASFGPVVLIPTVKIIGEEPRSNLTINPPDGPFTTFTFDFPCDCGSGFARKYFAPGGNVKIKILPFRADFTSEIRLLVHGQSRTLATNRDVGRVIDLGAFGQGTELIFYIHVRDTGLNFFMGSAARNRDGLAHARLECLGGGNARVFFEDFLGGGDTDYDDANFEIIATP